MQIDIMLGSLRLDGITVKSVQIIHEHYDPLFAHSSQIQAQILKEIQEKLLTLHISLYIHSVEKQTF